MNIGFSEQMLEPKYPVTLAGYGEERVSHEAHDPIFVRAIMIDGDERILMLNYDIVGFDHLLLDPLYELCKQYDIDKKNIFVCATHTHSAPGGLIDMEQGILRGSAYIMMDNDTVWLQEVLSRTKLAITRCIETLSEGSIGYVETDVNNFGSNRNDNELLGDSKMYVYAIKNRSEQIILYNYSCHPTILKGDNLRVSADFPGVVNQLLKEKGYRFAFFMNGSSGDISTRFTRKKDGFEEVERYGKLLVDLMLKCIDEKEMTSVNKVTSDWIYVEMTSKVPQDIEEAKKQYRGYMSEIERSKHTELSIAELRILESYAEGAKANVEYASHHETSESYMMGIQVLSLGIQFVAIPGEIFSELTNAYPQMRFISYANGYYGYFADEKAYDNNYYEALSSPFGKGQSEKMINEIYEKNGGRL